MQVEDQQLKMFLTEFKILSKKDLEAALMEVKKSGKSFLSLILFLRNSIAL